ncbi:MAG TPA: hypothetical protein VHB21_19480 [Minicystis sp.]|nr:hypothetical protein [Minicystis sp.]
MAYAHWLLRASALVSASLVVAVAVTGCVGGGNCDCSFPGVTVEIGGGITTDDIASFTTNDVCGPVPDPLCDPNLAACALDQQKKFGWSVDLRGKRVGTCQIHVTLKDGTSFDETADVAKSNDGCCSGFFGPTVTLPPKK